jgi:hypothetical protein
MPEESNGNLDEMNLCEIWFFCRQRERKIAEGTDVFCNEEENYVSSATAVVQNASSGENAGSGGIDNIARKTGSVAGRIQMGNTAFKS